MVESPALRDAVAPDADAIAAMHADSWRRFYRGAYSDDYLDGDIAEERRDIWTARLDSPSPDARTTVATSDGQVVGFVHVVLNEDPTWGSLIDSLHVNHALRGHGLGSALIVHAATSIAASARAPHLYLWVMEQNLNAQSFYKRHGALCAERVLAEPPGGVASRLTGTPAKFRYVWADARAIGSADHGTSV